MATPALRSSSTWSLAEIEAYLDAMVVPVRFACISGKAPLICSLWYLYEDGKFWLATQKGASVADFVRLNPNCGIEVAGEQPPYRGVRGQGVAVLDFSAGPTILARLIRRYLGDTDSRFARWLLSRRDDEVAIVVEPSWLTSWDFTPRMQASAESSSEASDRG